MFVGRRQASERLSGERAALGKWGLQPMARDRTTGIRPEFALTKSVAEGHAFVSRCRQ
jgi:hypothetical protein